MNTKTKLPAIIYTLGIIFSLLISLLLHSFRYFGKRPAVEPTLIEKLSELLYSFNPRIIFFIVFLLTLRWRYAGGIVSIITGILMFVISFMAPDLISSIFVVIPVSFAAIIAGMLFVSNYTEF